MITVIIIIGIIWFFVSTSSSGSSSSGNSSTSNSYTTRSNSNNSYTSNPTANRGNNNNSHSNTSYNNSGHSNRTTSNSGSSSKPSRTSYVNKEQKPVQEFKCSKCYHIHNSQKSNCEKCGWNLSKIHINFTTNLSGVTYEGRQGILAQTNHSENITLRRDKNNQYDRNAVGVYDLRGRSLGWVPKGYAAIIAPLMDKGDEFYAEIKKVVGGNNLNYGIQVTISNDLSKMKKSASISKPTPKPVAASSNSSTPLRSQYKNSSVVTAVKIPAATPAPSILVAKEQSNSTLSESIYLDNVLLRHADKESRDEVLMVFSDFVKYKRSVLPYLNRQKMNDLRIMDLEGVFDNAIMLAGGRESNFVHRYYKAIMVQLAFQLGFLIHRILPETEYARYAQNKMNWLSTLDVRLETKLLQGFFNQHVIVRGESPIVYDSSHGDQVRLWDIDEITYVLTNLTELGQKFNSYIDKN